MAVHLNPVTRGDLRARLASPKVLWLFRVHAGVLAAFAILSLPPEAGRLPQLQDADLLRAFLSVTIVLIVYFTSALAIGEIGVDGEKSLLDLAASTFTPREIVAGKLWTSLLFASLLAAVALPIALLLTPRGVGPIGGLLAAGGVAIVIAAAVAAVSAWLNAAVESDLLRTAAHWTMLLLLFALARWPGNILSHLSPLRVGAAALYRQAGPWPLALAAYAALALTAGLLAARSIRAWRVAPA